MLDNLSAKLRPRTSWQSTDLGFALARTHFWEACSRLLLLFGPIWLVLAVFLWQFPLVFIVLTWWLKPWYARVPLWVFSQRLFGLGTGWPEFRKRWRWLLFKQNLFALTLGRFSLARSVVMPIRILENAPRAVFSQRRFQLASYSGNASFWTICVLSFLHGAFISAGVAGISYYAPHFFSELENEGSNLLSTVVFGGWNGLSMGPFWWVAVCHLVGMVFTEIFYVGAGFGMYLNARTLLEGWDIEVTFRSLRERLVKMGMAGLLVASFFLWSSVPANALPQTDLGIEWNTDYSEVTGETEAVDRDLVKAEVDEILQQPQFKVHEHEESYRKSSASSSSSKRWRLPELGPLFTVMAWGAFITVLGVLLYILVRTYKPSGKSGGTEKPLPAPRVVAGQDLSPERLPTNIQEAARGAMQEGNFHEALRLLYSGSLRWMAHAPQFRLRESDTEGDVLRQWQSQPETTQKTYFAALSDRWILSAYASRQPKTDEMTRLCDSWPFAQS
jgi:hypothetical protein